MTDLDLLREEEQDSEHPITEYAYETTRKLLDCVTHAPCIAPDQDGGLSCEWHHRGWRVRAKIPAQLKHIARGGQYIYYSFQSSGVDDLSALPSLLRRLYDEGEER